MLRKLATNLIKISRGSMVRVQSNSFVTRTSLSSEHLRQSQDNSNKLVEKILKKSQPGRALAQTVTESGSLDKFEREQRYEIFINKMKVLYKAHRQFQKKLRETSKRMRNAHLLYQTPIKQVLSEYNKMTSQGFNCELLATSLENLNGVIQARGNKPLVYTDYTISEMDQSWRMEKVAEDVKFGLTHESVFFSPKNMARSSRQLGEIGYKNTELISIWLSSLQKKLKEEGEIKITPPPSFESVVYGSMKNFTPRYYVFQGFQSDKEFHEHVQTLLYFKSESNKPKNYDSAANETQVAMKKVIDAAKEIRELQVDQQAAIESLRQQYFKLQAAQNKHEFLQENKYLVYDMLELQELLVKGGYLDAEEALLGAKESVEAQMERASNVFYDLVLNHTPELLSPQYEAFYNAATASEAPLPDVSKEHQNELTLGFLSDILVGLAEQSQSHRRDAKDKDYPNEYYEQLLMPEEIRLENRGVSREEKFMQEKKTEYVMMEQSYLNSWRNFSAESGKIISENFKKLIQNEQTIDGLLKGLRALSACKFEAKKYREKINKALLTKLKSKSATISAQAGIDGLVGMANCAYSPANNDQVINQITEHLWLQNFTFGQKLELLNAMALLASKDPKIVDLKLFKRVMNEVSSLEYEAIDNDLTYKQYIQLCEVHKTLKFLGKSSFENKMLVSSLQSEEFLIARYGEGNAGHYDPLKSRVAAGLARGLVDTDLTLMSNQQRFNEFVAELAMKPDILTGFKGDQLAIYILNNRQFMHDTMAADGRVTHLLSLSSGVKPVTIPLDSVVDYDLQKFQLKIKNNFDLNSLLGIKDSQPNDSYVKFAKFAGTLTRNLNEDQISGNFDGFIDQLAEFFRLKSRLEYLHEPDQLLAANDELKLSLIKLTMAHDQNLTPQEQTLIHTASGSSFKQIIKELRQSINKQHDDWSNKRIKEQIDSKFDFNWQGTRQSVELPIVDCNTKKAIEPELLSRKFLAHGSYHHYDDWKKLMQECYDQFNLMELNEPGIKMNFDPVDHNRRVPKGIFPLPNTKREIMQKPGAQKSLPSHSDRFTKFEKDPHQYMLEQELQLSKQLKKVTPVVSLITNLQNIKYALLADCSDEEICSKLLLQLPFTDNLIQEHLSRDRKNYAKNLLPRDPAAFRKYIESQPKQPSAFDQFYLKEGLKQGRSKEIYDEVVEKHRKFDSEGLEELRDELDNILVKNEKENEDLFNLSSSLANYVNIKVDLKSLGLLDLSQSVQRNNSISDEEFLQRERCLAESRLIKTKILYKIHKDVKLTDLETTYLKSWKEAMSQNQTLMHDCLVPEVPSKMKIQDLGSKDLHYLNQLPRVNITRDLHGKFALNDLLLELSQVFDHQTVRAVELTCLQETMKNDWKLGKDFKLVTKRNKEIDLVLAQYEEMAFRASGQFTPTDLQCIKDMFLVGRGMEAYDRAYLEKDIKSLEMFVEDSNSYDNRIQMLEKWLCRKEQEIKSRVNLPTPELQQPDRVIYQGLEEKYKPAREKLVSTISQATASQAQSEYQNLSSNTLHSMVESLCARLNLFNNEYPVFLPHAVRAIMEHHNLSRSDRITLDTYCKIFQLDWRGDSAIANKEEFMATHPIYLNSKDQTSLSQVGEISNERVTKALRAACQPYLPQLAKKILEKQ